MLTFSPALAALLADDATKTQYATTIKDALGLTRRVRCWRDAADNAADPAATGTEFLNMAATGALTITGARIIGLGVTSDETINLAADLNTGTSVLRIEGGGHWIQGTLGLPLSDKDFIFTANPTGSIAVGFADSAGIDAPSLLDSGTGPLAPGLGPRAPHSVTLEDWSSGAAVEAGTRLFDTRLPNMVFDDAEMAESMGDVRIAQFSSAIPFYAFEFGATMFGLNGVTNAEAADPVYEVLCGFTPDGTNWAGYPRYSGVNTSVTHTHMPAFKVVIKAEDGTVLHTHQMYDGLPINSPTLQAQLQDHANFPPRPLFNCGQLLPWRSSKLKLHTYARKYHNGMETDILRPTLTRQKVSLNPAHPIFDFRNQMNSLLHWFGAPKRAVAGNTAGRDSNLSWDTLLFPIQSEVAPYGSLQHGAVNAFGWGYEPGANTLHDIYTGPGGVRPDRNAVPHVVALYLTDPNYVRPHRNDPIGEMVEHSMNGYFNVADHHLADARTFSTIPFDEVMQGKWSHGRTYYGGNASYVAGGLPYTIPVFSIANGAGADNTKPWKGAVVDTTGNMFWDGHSIDYMHNYNCPGYGALLFNSPMHVYAQKHRLISSVMCMLNYVTLSDQYTRTHFMSRTLSWQFLQYAVSWKMTSNHSLGMDRFAIETRLQRELERIYNTIYTDTVINNGQGVYERCLRNLGVCYEYDGTDWGVQASGMMFYMAGAFQLMRQTGLWHTMRTKSAKCEAALLFMVKIMDKFSVDWILDTDGRVEGYMDIAIANRTSFTDVVVPDSWADYAERKLGPKVGVEDWITNADGTGRNEREANQHLRAQWVFIRERYFPEIACERTNGIALAAAKFRGYYATKKTRLDAEYAAGSSSFTLRAKDWTYRWAGCGEPRAPQNNVLGEY